MKEKIKVGLFITTYNRPDELRECLESLKHVDLKGVEVLIVDDCSSEQLINLVPEHWSFSSKPKRKGIKDSIRTGYEQLFKTCNFVINLDGDAVVKPNLITELLRLHKLYPDKIITGFHSMTQGRHPIIEHKGDHCIKRTVGGINMAMNKETYAKYVLPSLSGNDNWDRQACINAGSVVCAVPSLVQHIGIKSSMNHNEEMDVAADFCQLSLEDVTLIGATGSDLPGLIKAADISCRDIKFGAVRLLSHLPSNDPRVISIEPLLSKEAYNEFIVRKLHKYVDTPYLLIIQSDGYVLNWKAWNDVFLKYDYIGASWWFKDGMNIGNGGFSLRTKALMQHAAKVMVATYPEDQQICRLQRGKFDEFQFAPAEVADRFSIEAHNTPAQGYNGAFGFHGYNVDYTGWQLPHIPQAPKNIKPSLQPRKVFNVRNGVKTEVVTNPNLYKRRW